MIYDRITDLIGDTPLLKLPQSVHELDNIDVYAKLELRNPWGSLKDRIAWAMVEDDIDVLRKQGRTLIESSSGNSAKALQAIASSNGVSFRTVTNRIKVEESRDTLTLMGASITELPGTSDCHDPNDPNDPLVLIEREVAMSNGSLHHTSQYTNEMNVRAHYRTGDEIADDLGAVDFFVGGLGTTGSTRGVGERLLAVNPNTQVVGVVAESSDFIPGIRTADEMFEVGLYEPSLYSAVHTVSSMNAIEAMLRLVRNAGLLAGPTTGASLAGAIEHLRSIDAGLEERKTAVIIACDRMEGYLSYIKERRPDLFGVAVPPDSFRAHRNDSFEAERMSPDKAAAWIRDETPLVIDTRGHLAFSTGHIPGSINIVDDAFEKMIDFGTPFSNNTSVLIVCPVGKRSFKYASFLAGRGADARSLQGGIVAWRDSGNELERCDELCR